MEILYNIPKYLPTVPSPFLLPESDMLPFPITSSAIRNNGASLYSFFCLPSLRLPIADFGRSAISSRRSSPASKPLAALNSAEFRYLRSLSNDEDGAEDDDLCPVDCVKEFRTNAELSGFLDAAKQNNSLVVVDFYRTACGSCKYIEQGFIKLCKGAGDDAAAVIFLKHNVMDEYDEQSEVAEKLKIRVVPLFHFYKDGKLLESFATRDKTKIVETIQKYLFPSDGSEFNTST